jgi:hypothetical protein
MPSQTSNQTYQISSCAPFVAFPPYKSMHLLGLDSSCSWNVFEFQVKTWFLAFPQSHLGVLISNRCH